MDTVREYTLQPEELGFKRESLQDLAVDGVECVPATCLRQRWLVIRQNVLKVLHNMVALNAGAALYVAGLAGSIFDGVSIANEILAGGQGLQKMQQLADLTQGF